MNRTALFTGLEAFPLTVQELSFSNGWETNQPPHLKKVDLLEIKPIKKRTPLMNDVNSIQTRNMVLPCFSITERVLKNPPTYASNRANVQSMNSTTSYNPRPTDIPIQMPRGFTHPQIVF